MTFALFLLLATPSTPSPTQFDARPGWLDRVTVADAERFQGRAMLWRFRLNDSPDWRAGRYVIHGMRGPDDGVERTACLLRRRPAGSVVAAIGVVKVVRHRAAIVGGVTVPGWVEVAFVEVERVNYRFCR